MIHLARWPGSSLGADPTQIELLWHHMFKVVHYQGYAGAEMRAISAIDIALWDLLGKNHQSAQCMRCWAVRAATASRPTTPTRPYGRNVSGSAALPRRSGGAGRRMLLAMGIKAMRIWPFDDQAVPSLGQNISAKQLEYGVSKFRAIQK